jgi:hypothetical protein
MNKKKKAMRLAKATKQMTAGTRKLCLRQKISRHMWGVDTATSGGRFIMPSRVALEHTASVSRYASPTRTRNTKLHNITNKYV